MMQETPIRTPGLITTSRFQLTQSRVNLQTRLLLGIICGFSWVACRPDIPQTLPLASSVSDTTEHASTPLPIAASTQSSGKKSSLTHEGISFDASPTELKYRVLKAFPNQFFCDPDAYPVARANETALARKRLLEVQANPEEFQAILKQNGLSGLKTFTGEQTLLISREHEKLRAVHFDFIDGVYQFQLQIKEGKQQGFLIKGFIDDGGAITVQEREPTLATCPVCLASQTQIDTPEGPVAVADLRVGDPVWTVDAAGVRLTATIVKMVRVPVPPSHQIIHVMVEDGRELWISPGHPTVDERRIADLRIGDFLSGGRITRIEKVAYKQPATYDLLPSGQTGYYWANGILLGSTLTKAAQ